MKNISEGTIIAVDDHLNTPEFDQYRSTLTQGGKARYEELNESHHDHLIDVKTGEIIEFVDEEIEKLQKKVAEKYGYKLVDHKLELYGVKVNSKK